MFGPILTRGVEIARYCMEEPYPLTLKGACAVAGNAWQENLCRPLTIGRLDHGSNGMMQWRLSRLQELKKRPHWDTLAVQCAFFKDECRSGYHDLWRMLTVDTGHELHELSDAICWTYERPARQYAAAHERVIYSTHVYDAVRELAEQQGTS